MKQTVYLGTKRISFSVQFRKRRTLEIRVVPPGELQVVAPLGTREELLFEVLQKKEAWILRKLEEAKAREARRIDYQFVTGEPFYYLGEQYPLHVAVDDQLKAPVVALADNQLQITSPSSEKSVIRSALEKWFRQQAQEIITERVQHYSPYVGRRPARIRVKEQKKRWGSCTSRGDLLYNWRCVMAPLSVLDYVVVHELCHLVHMNHSRHFWALVSSIMPDYSMQQAWLDENGFLFYW